MNLRALMKRETIRCLQLVEKLYYATDALSSEQLMAVLACSRPTLISDIHFLNEANLPFRITKTNGLYTINFESHATIDTVYAYFLHSGLEFQTIESLFFEKNYSIQAAALHLNCSFSNMQRYLQSSKHLLRVWGFSVCHRPLRVVGEESLIRRFFFLFFKESQKTVADYGFSQTLIASLDQFIQQLLVENDQTNDLAVHSQLLHSFLIALYRQKRGHFLKQPLLESGMSIPKTAEFDQMVTAIKRETALEFTMLHLKDCLWPLFSHQLIVNEQQQILAQQENKSFARFYVQHQQLLEKISYLLTEPLSQIEITETLRFLGNQLFCYFPNKQPIAIIQEIDKMMVTVIEKTYSREVHTLKKIVSDFLNPRQQKSLVPLYLNCLITTIDNLLPRLVGTNKAVNVLLLPDTFAPQQRFWSSLFADSIKGVVNYEVLDAATLLQNKLTSLAQAYDLIITNKTVTEKLAKPIIAVNTYPTTKELVQIQRFINQFETLPARKER